MHSDHQFNPCRLCTQRDAVVERHTTILLGQLCSAQHKTWLIHCIIISQRRTSIASSLAWLLPFLWASKPSIPTIKDSHRARQS